jgi:hypothetical protein
MRPGEFRPGVREQLCWKNLGSTSSRGSCSVRFVSEIDDHVLSQPTGRFHLPIGPSLEIQCYRKFARVYCPKGKTIVEPLLLTLVLLRVPRISTAAYCVNKSQQINHPVDGRARNVTTLEARYWNAQVSHNCYVSQCTSTYLLTDPVILLNKVIKLLYQVLTYLK